MRLESADSLLTALRTSGLLSSEQLAVHARAAPDAALRRLVRSDAVTVYQLKKVRSGKTADLFVGPYVVTDKLGEGGMGKVYRARDAGGQTVALKVVRSALLTHPTIRGRYAREVQATAKLDHPNIVRVFDAGEADGKFYLAMEFVDGIDLSRLMRDYRMLEVTEACEYVRQAALGLQHAHDMGFVHRDVKPSNIVVAGERHLPQATEPAVVKLLDLGLSRAIDPSDMVAPDLTRDHTVVGTPDYMAPEQAKDSRRADPRADLYSLGCTLFFLLIGRVPFPRTTAFEKLMAHYTEVPPSVRALRPGVPAGVADVVVRLMAKRPEDRFASAAEVAAALAAHAVYPHGAKAVPVRPVEVPAELAASLLDDTASGRSSSAGGGSTAGPLSLLNMSEAAAGANSPYAFDNTPGPNDPSVTPPARVGPRRNRPAARKRGKPPREVSPLVWILLAVSGVALVALAVWLATKS